MSKKKKIKLGRAAHIKRHTEGTSNELSFSVLDAAKRRADAKEGTGEVSEIPNFGKIPIFALGSSKGKKKKGGNPKKDNILPLSTGETIVSPSDASGSSSGLPAPSDTLSGLGQGIGSAGGKAYNLPYSSPETEIERRKSKRRRQRFGTTLAASIVLLAVLGGGGYLLFKEVSNHQAQVSLLDQAIEKILEVDDVIVPLDEIVNSKGDNNETEKINKLLSQIPDAQEKLEKAEKLANQAVENMRDSSEKEAAEQALIATRARKEMLDAAVVLLETDIAAKNDAKKIDQAWNLLLEGDASAREAAALVLDTTNENIEASKPKSEEAQGKFNEALTVFNALTESDLEPDLQKYITYTTKRAEAMAFAIASDVALLEQKRVEAEENNNAYNAAEEEAAQIAKEFPTNIADPIVEAYVLATEESRASYEDARSRASSADAFIRDYLGT